jgi:uncharacterized YccA/Bax inhibitor family protein
MQSSNPVLSKSDAFTRGGYATFNTATPGQLTEMYNAPSAPSGTDRMTLDDVIVKTALTLGVVMVTGALSWVLLPVSQGRSYAVAMVAALVGFGLAMANTFKRTVSPPLVIAYAAVEGVFLGVISHTFNDRWSGIVVQAVLGTGLAFVAMLAAYRARIVRVTPKFTKMLLAAGMAFLGLAVVNLVLGLFGVGGGQGLGLRSMGAGGLLFGIIGIVLATFFLALDFDQVERGVREGVPEREAWRAAFGLTVTLVWLYMEILRVLAILRGDN